MYLFLREHFDFVPHDVDAPFIAGIELQHLSTQIIACGRVGSQGTDVRTASLLVSPRS
jgi:hypothetical protein